VDVKNYRLKKEALFRASFFLWGKDQLIQLFTLFYLLEDEGILVQDIAL